MNLTFTAKDFARFEAASRVLLAPLAAPDASAWLLETGRALRDLLGGEGVALAAPGNTAGLYSEDVPDFACAVTAHIAAVTAEGINYTDPVANAFKRMWSGKNVDAFTWDVADRLIAASGYRSTDSPIMVDVLQKQGVNDYAGLLKQTAQGEAMVWVLGRKRHGLRFGEGVPSVLQALAPSFRSGLDALGRFGAHRAALDTLNEPLAVFTPDGSELHRNAALARLLDADAERTRIEAELHLLARGLRPLVFARREKTSRSPATERLVQTGRGRYTMRGSALPPGAFGPEGALLVSVAFERAGTLPLPDPDALRSLFSLTRREAEIALLLAHGLANADIAERLFVSPHTVRHHVENVMAKLDVSSRAAVAAHLLRAQPAEAIL